MSMLVRLTFLWGGSRVQLKDAKIAKGQRQPRKLQKRRPQPKTVKCTPNESTKVESKTLKHTPTSSPKSIRPEERAAASNINTTLPLRLSKPLPNAPSAQPSLESLTTIGKSHLEEGLKQGCLHPGLFLIVILGICDPSHVVERDILITAIGSLVAVPNNPSWRTTATNSIWQGNSPNAETILLPSDTIEKDEKHEDDYHKSPESASAKGEVAVSERIMPVENHVKPEQENNTQEINDPSVKMKSESKDKYRRSRFIEDI